MTFPVALTWLHALPRPRIPAFCHPFRWRQQALLTRVGQVIANRLEVIQSDWEDDLEDGRPDTEILDNKHRSRTREVNAVLCALQREFPTFHFPEGVHPLDLRDDVNSAIGGRNKAAKLPMQKVGP